MTFLLRQKSHSTDGREIIRPSRVEGDRITIGRDPDCTVHLTDLAVALHHATIEKSSGGRLTVVAEAGLTFELNGRKVMRGHIDLGTGGDMRIASHILRFMPTPAASDEIAVDVERVAEGEIKRKSSDERMFSLASSMPGKRATAWALSIVVLALFLAWPIKAYYDRQQPQAVNAAFHPDTMWDPGGLSSAHAQLGDNCQACHVKAFEAVPDASCKSCHTQVHDHANPFRLAAAKPDAGGWTSIKLAFQKSFDIPPGRCVECHTEHEGPQPMPVTAQRFCSDCHQSLSDKLPDTKLGNAGDFGTSHPEFRPAVLTAWNDGKPVMKRVSLAANPREDSGLKFPHDMHLSTSNGVAQMARRLSSEHGFGESLDCADCHDAEPGGARFQPVDMEEDCSMCHSLDFDRQGGLVRTLRHGAPEQVIADLRDFYRGSGTAVPANLGGTARRRPGAAMETRTRIQFARGGASPARAEQAIRAVFSRGGACFGCHEVDNPGPGALNFKIQPVAFPVRYMQHGWFDHKPHETESCSSCHAAGKSNSASDLLLPDLASCRTCHGGETARAKVQSSCAMCHDYHMDEGAPAMLVRQLSGGKKRNTDIAAGQAARPVQ